MHVNLFCQYPLKEVVVVHRDESVLNSISSLENYIVEVRNISLYISGTLDLNLILHSGAECKVCYCHQ